LSLINRVKGSARPLYGVAPTKPAFRSKFAASSEPFTLLVNGEVLAAVSLPPAAWKSLLVDFSGAPFDTPFVMEMRLEQELREFSDGLFSAHRRRFGESGMKRLMRAARAILPSATASG
jgi:hypothetical protein